MTTTTILPGLYPATEAIKAGSSRRYFIVESEAGQRAVHEASGAYEQASDRRKAFAAKHGADGVFMQGPWINGLAVPKGKEPAQGVDGLTWKLADQSNVRSDTCDLWVAVKGRKKAERASYFAMEREIDKLRPPCIGSMVAKVIGMTRDWTSPASGGRCYLHNPEAFDIDGVFVLAFKHSPKDMQVPDGVREIDTVTFIRMAMDAIA